MIHTIFPLQLILFSFLFFFNDTATTKIYTSIDTLSLHDALPISHHPHRTRHDSRRRAGDADGRSEEHTSDLQSPIDISYAVFCLKKKKNKQKKTDKLNSRIEQKQEKETNKK